jgi:hypothetical protein
MAVFKNFGVPGISDKIAHPKLKNKFRVVFTNLGGGGVESTPLSANIKTFTKPNMSFDETQVDRYNSRAWIQGKYTVEPISMVLEDTVDGTVMDTLQSQLQIQMHLTGGSGGHILAGETGEVYKFSATIEQLTDDTVGGKFQVLSRYNLYGCWFKSVDFGELDYSSSETQTITVSIRYDYFTYESAAGMINPGKNSVN